MGTARRRLRRLHRHCGAIDEDAQFRGVDQGDPPAGAERLPAELSEHRNTDTGAASRKIALPDTRADAFSRLFEAVHEGVYIGLLGPRDTKTLAANPHLKLIFGYAEATGDAEIRPFEPLRFVDPQ